jgi:sec-independent protein translocase protein TatC
MAKRGAALEAPDQTTTDDPGGQMSFLDHLEELRTRLIYASIGVAIGVAIAFVFITPIFDFIVAPLQALLPPGSAFISTRPAEMLGVYIQIALIAATVLAAPWIMYQVWRFIAPGLYRHERRYVIPFVTLTSVGFVSGALFNHYVAFRLMMTFFAGLSGATVRFMPGIESVFDLYVRMLFGMGLVFQMPTVAYFLATMGVVTAGWLLRQFKYAVLLSVVIAAVVTPSSDPWNQLILAGTMLALYVVCIGIVALFGRTPARDRTATVLIFPAGWWYLRRRQPIEGRAIARLFDIRSHVRESTTRL